MDSMVIEHHDLLETAIQDENTTSNNDEEESKNITATTHFDAIVPPLSFSKNDKATIGLARRMKKWFRRLLGKN
jgi:hypothetical protein